MVDNALPFGSSGDDPGVMIHLLGIQMRCARKSTADYFFRGDQTDR